MQIREWTDGSEVAAVLLIRELETRSRSDGSPYLRVTLADRTGKVVAMIWENVGELQGQLAVGGAMSVVGRYELHPRYGPQLRLSALTRAEEGSYDPRDLLDGPPRGAGAMEADLRGLLATIQNPYLGALLDEVFAESSPVWGSFRDAPAAKYYHQAYRHGLLEHSLGVAQAVSAISATFPGVDRDIAVTGALLHDIGKLEAYEREGLAIEMSDDGRLQGEIPLGYYRVRRAIEDLPGFPRELAQAVLHIILSHHGSLEHGSPVVPCTREATLVHMIDNLGGRLGSFDRIEKELPAGELWSRFDRGVNASAYFGGREVAAAADAARKAA